MDNIASEDTKSRFAIFNGRCVHEIDIFPMHIIIDTKTGQVLLQESTVQSVYSSHLDARNNFAHTTGSRQAEHASFEDAYGKYL